MSDELPEGWREVCLGDLCTEDRQGIARDDPRYASMPYLGLEHIESDTGRILSIQSEATLSETKSNNFVFTTEHVLYGKLRPYLNKVALPSFSGRCTTEIIPLLPRGADRRWLAWFLRCEDTVDFAMQGKTGSRMPRASMRDLMKMNAMLPPLDEQVRIVELLEAQLATTERARQAARAQLETLEAMPAAILREIFPRSPAARLPRGWRWVQLGEMCEITIGKTPPRREPHHWGPEHPWVTIADITAGDGVVYDTKEMLSESGALVCRGRLIPAGTLMYSFKLSIGKMAISGRDLYTNEAIAGLIPKSAQFLNQTFLRHALTGVDTSKLTGHAVKGRTLNRQTIKQIPLPLPPLREQQAVVQELERDLGNAAIAQESVRSQLDALDAMPAALLRVAFSA